MSSLKNIQKKTIRKDVNYMYHVNHLFFFLNYFAMWQNLYFSQCILSAYVIISRLFYINICCYILYLKSNFIIISIIVQYFILDLKIHGQFKKLGTLSNFYVAVVKGPLKINLKTFLSKYWA